MQIGPLGRLIVTSGLLTVALGGCGDDGGGDDAGTAIDASTIRIDVMNGVLCAGAEANYAGNLATTGAQDDGTNLLFQGALNSGSPPDLLQLQVASNASAPTGTFDLPAGEWSVSLCIDDSDGSCANALSAFSGSLRVDSVTTRLEASLDRVIFVDNLTTPTCSASLTQASLDVAIDVL